MQTLFYNRMTQLHQAGLYDLFHEKFWVKRKGEERDDKHYDQPLDPRGTMIFKFPAKKHILKPNIIISLPLVIFYPNCKQNICP